MKGESVVENSHGDYSTMSRDMQAPFVIDPEFQNKIPPISEDEFRQLRENILAAGEVYEPLVAWDGVLVDGHNRWKIIQEHPEVKWRTREMHFTDKWAAFEWMYKNQLGRRNLTDAQRTYMIGKMYEARKKSHGGDHGNQYTKMANTQSGNLPNRKQGTAGQIARELGVGNNTVIRAEKFAKGVDALRKTNPEAADKVLNGKAKVTKWDVAEIGSADRKDVEAAADAILNEMSISPLPTIKKMTKVRVKTPEDMANMQEIEAIVNDMYDPSTTPEFTIDLLLDDIQLNAEIYVQLLANTLQDRSNLVTDENKPRIAAAINKVVEDILKVRDSM